MSLYNGPPRGGSRGGRDQFNWENVKADKDREFYLGALSPSAPAGAQCISQLSEKLSESTPCMCRTLSERLTRQMAER